MRLSLVRRIMAWHTSTIASQTVSFCVVSGDPGAVHKSANLQEDQYGFKRREMYKDVLHGTVLPYQRHVFLCHRSSSDWPPVIETSSLPNYQLPRHLADCLKANKGRFPKQTRLTVSEGCNGIESSTSDVLIFPDVVMYKNIQSSDVEDFMDHVLINESVWPSRKEEQLTGSHVFVCSHGSRDMRCGVCGPVLIDRFTKEISLKGLKGCVFVRACSHVGGHKYAGNVIIYGKDINGQTTGHWYGYVTPEDVSTLIDEHIVKGQVIDKLWRGQMSVT